MKKLLIYPYLFLEMWLLYIICALAVYHAIEIFNANIFFSIVFIIIGAIFYVIFYNSLKFRNEKLIYKAFYPNIKRQLEVLEDYLEDNYRIETKEIPFITRREILKHSTGKILDKKYCKNTYLLSGWFVSPDEYKKAMRQLIEYHKERINYFNL
jgi:hypothetical protein